MVMDSSCDHVHTSWAQGLEVETEPHLPRAAGTHLPRGARSAKSGLGITPYIACVGLGPNPAMPRFPVGLRW